MAQWLERRTGDRGIQGILGSNPVAGTSLRNFGNSVYSALPVSFGGDAKSHQSFLSGVYARGSKRNEHPETIPNLLLSDRLKDSQQMASMIEDMNLYCCLLLCTKMKIITELCNRVK